MTQTAPQTGALHFGAPPGEAQAVMILVHGRGASALSMRPLAEAWARPGLAFLAPEAARQGGSWYPYSFMAPIEDNQPQLGRALDTLDRLVKQVLAGKGGIGPLPPEKILLAGFSQGSCLAVEYAARNPRRYGGVAVLSGGLIGPPGTPRDYPGSFDGAPVFLGCSDVDPHIPKERVLETEEVLRGMGAQVTARLYPGMPHTINDDEIAFVDGMVQRMME